MKKTIVSALAFIAPLCLTTVSAEMPQQLRKYAAADPVQLTIFDAMDRTENNHRDGMCRINYDAFPDGRRVIMRQMINGVRKDVTDKLMATFDSVIALDDPRMFAVKSDNTVAYKFDKQKSTVIDLSNLVTGISGNAGAIEIRGNVFTAAQTWTMQTDLPCGAGDFTAIEDAMKKLAERPGALSKKVRYPFSNEGGAIRLRDLSRPNNNATEGTRIIYTKASTAQWIKTYDAFMAHFGANENISLTYYRNQRTVTLVDYSTKTIYAARFVSDIPNFASDGTLTIFIGHYTADHPYLPDNWANGNY